MFAVVVGMSTLYTWSMPLLHGVSPLSTLQVCSCSMEPNCADFLHPGANVIRTMPSGCEWLAGPPDSADENITEGGTTALGTAYRTRRCPQYTQYWTIIQGPGSNPTNEYPQQTNMRATAIAVPSGQPPSGGWPFVLQYEFMYPDGDSQGWAGSPDPHGGLLDLDMSDFALRMIDIQGRYQMQEAMHGLVNRGYALIMTSMYSNDNMFYNTNFYEKCDPNDYEDGCWNGGSNPDAGYLSVLMEKVKEGTLVPGIMLDYSRMGLMGYSVAAQMVSRSINDFPVMKTFPSQCQFPVIQAAVMIGGGSYFCYAADNLDSLPDNFKPCNKLNGCCPHNQTEEAFDNGTIPWSDHPPVLLLQTSLDSFADRGASKYYYEVMSRKTRHVQVCRVIAGGVVALRHGLSQLQVMPLVTFVQAYV